VQENRDTDRSGIFVVHMTLLVAIVVLVVVGVSQADPVPPALPLSFQADVSVSGSLFPFTVSGHLWYDYNHLFQRFDLQQFGTTVTQLDRFDQMNQYEFDSQQCRCVPEESPMPTYFIPPGTPYLGQRTYEGQQVDGWEVDLLGMITVDIWTSTTSPAELVMVNITINSGSFGSISTVEDFSNVQPGAIPSSVFDVPLQCANVCPLPVPPYVPTGSCPADPPVACACVSSQLSFCSQVDYPVPEALAFQPTPQDKFVQTAYNSAMSAAPNPSPQCKSNMQTYLCAFYFPRCGTNGILFLPCPGLCPCACGMAPANCTAGITSACTQYGSGSFC